MHTKESLMEQAQVFASAWSLIGGPFDCGDGLDNAEQARTELAEAVDAIVRQRDELLEALRAVMAGSRYYEIRGEADWHEISMPKRDALEKARAAIAKAEAA